MNSDLEVSRNSKPSKFQILKISSVHGQDDLVILQDIHLVDSAHPKPKSVVMLGQGGTCKIQQRHK